MKISKVKNVLAGLVLVLMNIAFFAQASDAEAPSMGTSDDQEVKSQKSPMDKAFDEAEQGIDNLTNRLEGTRVFRNQSKGHALGIYSPVDFILPSKLGLNVGGQLDLDHSVEFEYLTGSVKMPGILDKFGAMSERRYSLLMRNYFLSNSFNMLYGVSYNDFSVYLGNEMLSRLSSNAIAGADLIRVSSIGVTVGIGNRWILQKRYCFGIDWITWSQPVKIDRKESIAQDLATSQDDKDDLDTALQVMGRFPRISIFKLFAGFTF